MKYTNIKSSNIEWIGDIPSHWEIKRGKNSLTLLSRPVLDDDDIITCFRDGEVTLRKNRREEGFTNALLEIGYQGVKAGDLVVHGMDGFAGAIGISDSRGKASPVLNVMDSPNCKRFLMYYLRSLANKEVFLSLATGIRVRSCDLRWNKLAVLPFILPPLSEQNAIAAYLDEKCGTIDAIIEEAKASIEEYKAWKSSVIFEAVTKGLNPNAEMKDSGVEWIGKVPKHWDVCKLKYLCSMQAGKNIPSELLQDNGEYPVYGGNGLRGYYSKFNMEQDCILIGRQGALCGNVHIVSGKYWATEHAVITRVTNIENLQHLYYLLIGMNLNQYASDAAAQPGLTVGAIKDLYVPLTPETEQEAIVAALDKKCAAIDGIIAEKETLIADMEAYKKSLIFETVTGKRKVY